MQKNEIIEVEPTENAPLEFEPASDSRELIVRPNTLPSLLSPKTSQESLESYLRFVNQIPLLSAEEEKKLAEQLRYHQDLQAAEKLILSHLRFVVKVARNFQGYGLPQADLIQEGNIGLMKAVKRFDPNIGVRLVSFAVHWIKSEMHEYIVRNWRMVKIATTKAQRKLFFNLRSSKKRLGWFSLAEVEEIAKELNVKPEEVLEMEKRLNAYDENFDSPEEPSAEEPGYAPALYLPAPDANPEELALENEEQTQLSLEQSLNSLDERSQDIIRSRWLAEDKKTLHDLAEKYQVSAERVRQIEEKALKTLKLKLSI